MKIFCSFSDKTQSILFSVLLHGIGCGIVLFCFLPANSPPHLEPVSISDVGFVSAPSQKTMAAHPLIPVVSEHSEQPVSVNSAVSAGNEAANGTSKTSTMEQDSYISELQKRIQSEERYPVEARKRGISGVIDVGFRLNKEGQIVEIHSNSPEKPTLLIEAALAAVKAAAPFPAPPAGISTDFRIPVDFKIK